jgi:hypothetical protein
MRPKLLVAMMACALVALSVGCASTGSTRSSEPGEPIEELSNAIPIAPESRIPDIPVPAGFNFDREHSFVFQNSRLDVGRIQYIGRAAIEDVAQFYLDEMPQHNWELQNVTEHGTIMLFFDKPTKSCHVMLSQKGRSVIVEVAFYPKELQGAGY